VATRNAENLDRRQPLRVIRDAPSLVDDSNAPKADDSGWGVDGSGLARGFFTQQAWSEQPGVRPVSAVHLLNLRLVQCIKALCQAMIWPGTA
jgi:hypothetical protein